MAEHYEEWLDSAQEIDQDTVEQEAERYPYIQWVNGSPSEKRGGGVPYTGGFFISEEQALKVPHVWETPPAGWEAGELIHDNGSSTKGYYAASLDAALLHRRQAWRVFDGQTTKMFIWKDYERALAEGKPSGRLQLLGLVKGLEEMGPLMLTFGGTAARAVTQGVLKAFRDNAIAVANGLNAKRKVSAKFPYRAFWLTLSAALDGKGLPLFETVGTGNNTTTVALPKPIGLERRLSADELAARFVGRDLLSELNRHWRETESWARAWDSFTPREEETQLGAPKDANAVINPGNAYAPDEGEGEDDDKLLF